MTDKVCPLLKAANRTFLECVENQCAWYVGGACALNTLARNLHGVASCKQVTEALCHNGSGGFDESLATKKQVTSNWISVEERLPEDEKSVLAYFGFNNDGDGDLGIMFIGTLCYFCFDPNPHWQHASHNLVVTHWMPLPEPPEEA